MKIGDLVKMRNSNWVGIFVEFRTTYDTYGDPQEKYAIVNWNSDYPDEEEYLDDIEVISESR